MPTLPEIQVGEPIRHEALAVFPLFSSSESGVEYLLSDEAITAGSVNVEEVGADGSVQNLLVTNHGDSKVLFLEGENTAWDQAQAVGEGQEFRADADPRTHALALVYGEAVLHGSVVVAN
jgi:hypothetical protein